MKRVRNVTVDYVYRFFGSFDLADSIWVLFLGYRHMNLFEIGILEGIFHLTSILFEVPTGAIADLCGRKRTLIMGRISGSISALLMLLGGNFFVYMVAMITAAASYNLNSGSEEALVYDSLLEAGQEEKYLKINGRLYFLMQAGAAVGALVGGFISEYSFEMVYGLNVFVRLIACIVAFFYKEVRVDSKAERVTVKEHFKAAFMVLKENPKVAKLSIYYACIATAICTVMFYSQDYFSGLGMKNSQIATVGFVGGLIAASGALFADRLHNAFKSKTLLLVCVGVGVVSIAMASPKLLVVIPCYGGLLFGNSIMECIMSNKLNASIPSAQRATLLSVESMLFSIGMIVIFPLCGLIMTYVRMGVVIAGIGILAIIITLLPGSRRVIK